MTKGMPERTDRLWHDQPAVDGGVDYLSIPDPAGPLSLSVTMPKERCCVDGLYRQYWGELCGWLRKQYGAGPPDPEDVAQQAFTKYVNLKGAQNVKNPRAFLYTMARNIFLDNRRHDKCAESYIEEKLQQGEGEQIEEITPERVATEKERFALMVAATKKLPHKQQVVLTMNRMQGLSYSQISKKTGWSAADICRQMNAAMQTLADAVEKGQARKINQQASERGADQ